MMETDTEKFIPSPFKPSSLLPIARHRESLLYVVETYPVTIVVGQTGSGKTTQLPQFLYQAGWCDDGKQIAITQVRKHIQPRGVQPSMLISGYLAPSRSGYQCSSKSC